MNKFQRKKIQSLNKKIEEIRIQFEELENEEDEKFMNLPENLQSSTLGETLEESTNKVSEIKDLLSDVLDLATELV
jgi:hypothetical protein